MIYVLGLGNPGTEYEHTRHNAGIDALNKAAAFFQVKLRKRCFRLYSSAKVPNAHLIFPLTYMNNSGKVLRYFDIKDPASLVVVCDNMDLACGGLRIRKGGGASGQKGLNSITEKLGSSDFIRIYIGIGRPKDGTKVVDHVLGKETDPELVNAYEQALEDASKAIIAYINGASIEELQRDFNRKGIL